MITIVQCKYFLSKVLKFWYYLGKHPFDEIDVAASVPLDDAHLGMVLDEKISSPNRVIGSKNSYANVAVGLPDLVRCIRISVMSPKTLM